MLTVFIMVEVITVSAKLDMMEMELHPVQVCNILFCVLDSVLIRLSNRYQ